MAGTARQRSWGEPLDTKKIFLSRREDGESAPALFGFTEGAFRSSGGLDELRECAQIVIIRAVHTLLKFRLSSRQSRRRSACFGRFTVELRCNRIACGQVAQVVERSPEKAGVGGST